MDPNRLRNLRSELRYLKRLKETKYQRYIARKEGNVQPMLEIVKDLAHRPGAEIKSWEEERVRAEWLHALPRKDRVEWTAIKNRISAITQELNPADEIRERRALAPIAEEKEEQLTEQEIAKINHELQLTRAETVDERWAVHAAWEVRQHGFVRSDESDWKRRFVGS